MSIDSEEGATPGPGPLGKTKNSNTLDLKLIYIRSDQICGGPEKAPLRLWGEDGEERANEASHFRRKMRDANRNAKRAVLSLAEGRR